MSDKSTLINQLLQEHILTPNFYTATFDVFKKQFGVDLYTITTFDTEIMRYKNQLITRLSEYFARVYTLEELTQMSTDDNSPLWYRVITQEYKDIFSGEGTVFCRDLTRKIIDQGLDKRSWWKKLKHQILYHFQSK